jgi:hypothetical protein
MVAWPVALVSVVRQCIVAEVYGRGKLLAL